VIGTIAFLASVLAVVAHADQANLIIQYGNPNGIVSAEFSPDGRLVVTVGAGSIASLWEVESGKQIGVLGMVGYASFSPDSRHLLMWKAGSVEVHSIYSAETRSFPEQFNGVYSPDGKLVATSKGQTVTLWDAASGSKV
jgi:WD40 repeat protein